jgi:hypothetical protein
MPPQQLAPPVIETAAVKDWLPRHSGPWRDTKIERPRPSGGAALFQACLDLDLGEDDYQSEQREGLNERETQHQQQLNAGARAGVAGQCFAG